MRDSAGEARRWLAQAENDLSFGEIAVREGFFAQACFIAQQSAVKALKSMAYGLAEVTVLGHSVVELVHRLSPRVPALLALREGAGVLDQYYVATRYPDALAGGAPFAAFNERQAREAIALARSCVELGRERLSEIGALRNR